MDKVNNLAEPTPPSVNNKKGKFQFKFTDSDTEYSDSWGSFHPKKTEFRFTYSPWAYFDPRPQIITNVTTLIFIVGILITGISLWSIIWLPLLFFAWGDIYLSLPYNSGNGDTSEYPRYGIYMYREGYKIFNTIALLFGERSKYLDMPWYLEHYRTSVLLNTGKWEHEFRGDDKKFYEREDKWEDKYDYTYILRSGKKQHVTATIHVDEREWRRKWLMWTPLFNSVRKTIDINFSDEVGERSGSWKGGTIGCGYEMKIGEEPKDTLMRMQSEREFN